MVQVQTSDPVTRNLIEILSVLSEIKTCANTIPLYEFAAGM
jgi:hypothetical protein